MSCRQDNMRKSFKRASTWPFVGASDNQGMQSLAQPQETATSTNEISAACQDMAAKVIDDKHVTHDSNSEHISDMCSGKLRRTSSAPDSSKLDPVSHQSSSATPSSPAQGSTMTSTNNEGGVRLPTSPLTTSETFQEQENKQENTGLSVHCLRTPEPETPIRPPQPTLQGRVHAPPPVMTQCPQYPAIYAGPAASPGGDPFSSGSVYASGSSLPVQHYYTSPASSDLFSPPQLYAAAFNTWVPFSPHTPAHMNSGNPIPTPYHPGSFHFPRMSASPATTVSSPLPSRARMSGDWRQRDHLLAARPLMMSQSSFVPGRDIGPGISYQGRLVHNYQTLYSHPAQISGFVSAPGSVIQHGRGQRIPEPYSHGTKKVNFYGYVPSSCHRESCPTLQQIKFERGFVLKASKYIQEKSRAMGNLPKPHTEEQLELILDQDESNDYARWNAGYVEVNDDLIARCICPADLLQHPCPFDEFPEGCLMVRLCKELEKNTNWTCWDAEDGYERCEAFEGESKQYQCPHLHWEVEPSCRYVASGKPCTIVINKGYNCSVGHDFEKARQVSRSRFEAHVRDALLAGATRQAKRRCIVTNHHHEHKFHIEMAQDKEDALPFVDVQQRPH